MSGTTAAIKNENPSLSEKSVREKPKPSGLQREQWERRDGAPAESRPALAEMASDLSIWRDL